MDPYMYFLLLDASAELPSYKCLIDQVIEFSETWKLISEAAQL